MRTFYTGLLGSFTLVNNAIGHSSKQKGCTYLNQHLFHWTLLISIPLFNFQESSIHLVLMYSEPLLLERSCYVSTNDKKYSYIVNLLLNVY